MNEHHLRQQRVAALLIASSRNAYAESGNSVANRSSTLALLAQPTTDASVSKTPILAQIVVFEDLYHSAHNVYYVKSCIVWLLGSIVGLGILNSSELELANLSLRWFAKLSVRPSEF
ncbi:hypothetical protein [Ferrimonas pelagia]|uniref:Uncharacterized protein n=1 Tax=Ferrimonas pelagia TaxID=1177826 RepID=A0ABP9EUT6_9GAMM